MTSLSRSLRSSIGLKYIMATTGLGLFAFVIIHLVGNLQIFLGPEPINSYAAFLKSKPELLWGARAGLFAILVAHIASAIALSINNRRARPIAYLHSRNPAASYASKTMLASGVILFLFIAYHLLHFTVAVPRLNLLAATSGFANADFHLLRDQQGRADVFRMMILGFSHPIVSAFYILSMAVLCLHLTHGVSALFQSLGGTTPATQIIIRRFSIAAASAIFVGNCSIPIAILLGFGTSP